MTSYEEIFQSLASPRPRLALKGAIEQALMRRMRRGHRLQIFTMGLCSLLSFGALVPAMRLLLNEASISGFTSYVRLVVSDGSSALEVWRELLLSIAQTLPVMGFIAVLLSLSTFLLSLRFLFGTSRPFFIRYA